jgi:hypothetical protein
MAMPIDPALQYFHHRAPSTPRFVRDGWDRTTLFEGLINKVFAVEAALSKNSFSVPAGAGWNQAKRLGQDKQQGRARL